MKLNCLIRNTKIETSVRSAINGIVDFLVDSNIKPSFKEVYKTLKSEGLEIDMESVGALYVEETEKYGSDFFTNEDEVADIVGAKIEQTQREIVSRIKQEDATIGESKIGDISPEKSLANNIGKMFDRFINGALPPKTKSTMKAFEDLMKKAIVSSLPKIPKDAQKSITSSLDYFFAQEQDGFRTLSGAMNNLRTLHEATKKEINNYVEGLVSKLDNQQEKDLVREQWDSYTESIMNGMYDLMLGKGEQNKLLNEALKQIKIDGKSLIDKNGNIQWSKLSESGNVDVVKRAISDLFQEGIKNQDGSTQKYTQEQSDRIAQYLGTRYEQKLQAYIQRQQANARIKNQSPQNLASDFLKDEGYFEVGKKDGVLSVTKSDWKSFMNKLRSDLNAINKNDVINGVGDSFRSFLQERNNSLPSSEQLSDTIIEEKVKAFTELVTAKFAPSTSTPNALQKLVAFSQLNNGKAFNQSTQQAINKLSGVSDLDQTTLNRLNNISNIVANLISQNSLSPISSTNPKVSRSAYALQALSQLDREIKMIIRESKMDKSNLKKTLGFINDYISSATVSLLVNPNNARENILTAFGSSIVEAMTQFITNPRLAIKTQGGNFKVFWSAFFSHVMGGSHTSIMTDEDMSIDLAQGEVYTIRNIQRNIELAKNKPKAIIKEFAKAPLYLFQQFNRVVLNSFDAAFNSVIMRRQMMGSMYSVLKENGYSTSEAFNIIDESVDITPEIRQEINDEIKVIEQELKKVGIYLTIADKALMAIEMRNAQYDITLQKYVKNGMTNQQVSEATKSVLKASGEVSKMLTGKKKIPSNDIISTVVYSFPQFLLKLQQTQFDKSKKSFEQGNYKTSATQEFIGELFGKNGFAKFIGGIGNFANLAITSIPIIGMVQVSGVRKMLNNFIKDNPQSQSITNAESMDKLERYYELSATYRSLFARQLVSTLAMSAIVLAHLFDDDEEEGWFDEIMTNLMQTKSGQREIAKQLPLSMALLSIIAYSSKDKKLNDKGTRVIETFVQLLGRSDKSFEYLQKDIKDAKTTEQKLVAVTKYVGGIWNGNINQIEQLTKTGHVLKSATNKDFIKVVKRDEKLSRELYDEMNDYTSAFLGNGIISSMMRFFSDEDYNRYERNR
jgi:hypothetical protein